MKEIIAEARSLTKVFGKTTALKNVNLGVRRGEILGLVGDNGSGKSTFLKLLAGQIFPTEGEVSLFGVCGERDRDSIRSSPWRETWNIIASRKEYRERSRSGTC